MSPQVVTAKPKKKIIRSSSETLIPKRGKLFTYQIVKPADLHKIDKRKLNKPTYAVDLGFTTRIDLLLQGIKNPQEGQIIESVQRQLKSGEERYRFKQSQSNQEALYSYKATVERVVDGDTLWVQIDLGFRVWARQKLRLRGINTKEMGDGGEEATEYVRKKLSRVLFVAIKTTRPDKFDRYLADLFYLEGEEETGKVLQSGNFLNQELIDQKLAVRYDGE